MLLPCNIHNHKITIIYKPTIKCIMCQYESLYVHMYVNKYVCKHSELTIMASQEIFSGQL